MRSKVAQNILDHTPDSIKQIVDQYSKFITSEWYREVRDTLDVPVGLEEYRKIKSDPTHPFHKFIK